MDDETIPPRVRAAIDFLNMTKEFARPQKSFLGESEIAGAVPRSAAEVATERQALELLRLYFAGETDAGPIGRVENVPSLRLEPATSETHVG